MDQFLGQLIDGYFTVKNQLMTNCPCLNGETSNPAGYPPMDATMQMQTMPGTAEMPGFVPPGMVGNAMGVNESGVVGGGVGEYTTGVDGQWIGEGNVTNTAAAGLNPFLDGGGDMMAEEDEFNEFKSSEKISEWQAGWNVTNAIQGMFIVSLPYAVLHGGWWGVLVLIFCAYICCYTGKILVACLYEVNANGQWIRVRDSYVGIAKTVMGERYGGKMVYLAQNIELLMTCILYIVLFGELMIGSFPDSGIDQASWMMISTTLLLPCAFLKDLHAVSTLSFWCGISHIAINVIILGYCLLQIADWHYSEMSFHFNSQTFPVTLGIVVFSYTSQIFLPTLEGNLRDRRMFHCMLNWSHIAAALFKALFALVGFLTFGQATQEVITNNLPTRGFKCFINIILAVKALLSYPLPYFAAANLIETTLFKRKPTENSDPHGHGPQPFHSCWHRDGEFRVWAVGLRVLLVLVTMVMAISIPHFALLMGLIGSFTGTMLSFVWPCYFYMRLKWDTLPLQTITWNVFIICTGLFCGFIGIITSFNGLINKYHLQIAQIPYAPGTGATLHG